MKTITAVGGAWMPVALAMLVLAGCGKAQEKKLPPPFVSVAEALPGSFVDRIEAIGTARANEQAVLAAPVTERITRLNFEDGGYVQKGQVIATLAAGQEDAQLADAAARTRQAQTQLDRLQQLKRRGFATNADVDAQFALAASARAQSAEAVASIGDRVIRAPFSGFVSLRTISPGAVVTAGTPIVQISDLSRIKLDFPVPETTLASIRQGQPIDAAAAAFPDRRFSGTIETIDPVVDPTTRSVQVRAILPNGDRALRPGMLMTVGIRSATRTSLSVPEPAVVAQGDQRFVFVLGADNKVTRTPVKVGVRNAGVIEILDGLKPGQKVVTDGVVKVRDGGAVRTGPAGAGKKKKG